MDENDTSIIFAQSDYEDHVTNNRMELKGMLSALDYAADNPKDTFSIYSDSAYVVNSCNSWLRNWASNGWRNSKKQLVENIDLMKELWRYLSKDFFNAEVIKCDGHKGHVGNELADALATADTDKFEDLITYWELKVPLSLAPAGDDWFPID